MASQAPEQLPDDVPESWRVAADEVREHLVGLRGGAPFLSPADARVLLGWLEAEVSVSAILLALERAAASRRKRRSRLPLTLALAKRHLGRPTRGSLPTAVKDGHPLRPLRDAIVADRPAEDLRALAEGLLDLDASDAEPLARAALARVRAFFEARWAGLATADRAALLADAEEELEDLRSLLEPAAFAAAVEEAARDRLRRAVPLLTAATIWDLVET